MNWSAPRYATRHRRAIGFGERLDQALGRDAAVDFLKTAMRVSTEALLAGRSVRLARDQIEADLVMHLERVDSALLAIVVRQAGLAHDLATAIAGHLATLQAGRPADGKLLAARAGLIERKADRIAVEARNEASRLNAGAADRTIGGPRRTVRRRTGTGRLHCLAGAGRDRPGAAVGPRRVVRGRPSPRPRRPLRGSPPPSTSRKGAAPIPRMHWPR